MTQGGIRNFIVRNTSRGWWANHGFGIPPGFASWWLKVHPTMRQPQLSKAAIGCSEIPDHVSLLLRESFLFGCCRKKEFGSIGLAELMVMRCVMSETESPKLGGQI